MTVAPHIIHDVAVFLKTNGTVSDLWPILDSCATDEERAFVRREAGRCKKLAAEKRKPGIKTDTRERALRALRAMREGTSRKDAIMDASGDVVEIFNTVDRYLGKHRKALDAELDADDVSDTR